MVQSDAARSLSQREPGLLCARPASHGVFGVAQRRHHSVSDRRVQVRLRRVVRRALQPTWYSAGSDAPSLGARPVKARPAARADHALRFVVSGGAPLPARCSGRSAALARMFPCSSTMARAKACRSAPISCRPVVPSPAPAACLGRIRSRSWATMDGSFRPEQRGEILIGGPTVVSGYLERPRAHSRSLSSTAGLSPEMSAASTGRLPHAARPQGRFDQPRRRENLAGRNRRGARAASRRSRGSGFRRTASAPWAGYCSSRCASSWHGGQTPVELRRYLQDRVAAFKVPRRIVIRNQLPKGATGKVLRRLLSDSSQDGPVEARDIRLRRRTPMASSLIWSFSLTAIWERLLKICAAVPR